MKPIYKKIAQLQINAYDRAVKRQQSLIRNYVDIGKRAMRPVSKVEPGTIIDSFHSINQAGLYISQARSGKKSKMVRVYIRHCVRKGWLAEGTPLYWHYAGFTERLCRSAIWMTHGKGRKNSHLFWTERNQYHGTIDWEYMYEFIDTSVVRPAVIQG